MPRARQAIVPEPRKLVFVNLDLPDVPGPGQALLQTRRTFISAGTELAVYAGTDPRIGQPGHDWLSFPFKPGYANVATVTAIGDGVTQVRPGDRVFTFLPHVSHGLAHDWDWMLVERIPEGVSDDDAAAARMALVSITAQQMSDTHLNDWVVVFGLGAVGNLAAQLFQAAGARVIGVDPVRQRCDLAGQCGVEHTLCVSGADALEGARQIMGDQRPHACIDAVGHPAIVNDAVHLCGDHGKVIVLGSPRQPHDMNVTPMLQQMFSRWITVVGALEWRLPQTSRLDPHSRHSSQGNLRTIFELIAREGLRVRPLISHRLPASRMQEGYEGLLNHKDQYTGVVLDWAQQS